MQGFDDKRHLFLQIIIQQNHFDASVYLASKTYSVWTTLEQFGNSTSRTEDTSWHYSLNQYGGVLKHIAGSPDKNSPSLPTGYKEAIRIAENGGEDFKQHLVDYRELLNPSQADYVGNFLANKEAKLVKKTSFDVKQIQEEYGPKDNTAQFKKDKQEEHFGDFDVNGDEIEKPVEAERAKAQAAIDAAEAKIKEDQKKLEDERDREDNKVSFFAKIFALTNHKVKQKGWLNKTASRISDSLKGRKRPPESK